MFLVGSVGKAGFLAMGLALGVARGSGALLEFRVRVWPGSRVTLSLDRGHSWQGPRVSLWNL